MKVRKLAKEAHFRSPNTLPNTIPNIKNLASNNVHLFETVRPPRQLEKSLLNNRTNRFHGNILICLVND